jgi:SAM-dependent methyltransferase
MPQKKSDRNNWVSFKLISRLLVILCVLVAATAIAWQIPLLRVLGLCFTSIQALILLYFLYARYQFSPNGCDVQARISRRVLDFVDREASGLFLDIGCGNGRLTVELAKKFPTAQIKAIDYWEGVWGYSQQDCEALAKEETVADRIAFTKASASSLPFKDSEFDLVISNMVFHEVAGKKDKREVIKEALRPLKNGGRFVFQDQFNTKRIYGTRDELLGYVKDLGVEEVHFEDTRDAPLIPRLLRNPIFVGDIGLIHGQK